MRAWRERRAPGHRRSPRQPWPQGPPRITAAQRDAIYQQINERLHHAGDLSVLLEHGDLIAARRLARELSDDLQLILDALGWGETSRAAMSSWTCRLSSCAELSRLYERAVEQREASSQHSAEAQAPYERSLIVIETCDQVLTASAATPKAAPG